jgi:hypothetical protein
MFELVRSFRSMKQLLLLSACALVLVLASGCGGPKVATDPPADVKAKTDNAASMTTGIPNTATQQPVGGTTPPAAAP